MDKLRCGGLNKFIVIKKDDVEKYLSSSAKGEIEEILDTINYRRNEDGREPFNEYIVVNTDETYAGEIIEILKRNGHWG